MVLFVSKLLRKYNNSIRSLAWALNKQPLNHDIFLWDCLCYCSGDQMLNNMLHPWGNHLYSLCRLTVYWKTWQPSISERVSVNISIIIGPALWSCYALVYGKGRGLRLIHWSPNHHDKDNSVREGELPVFKETAKGEVTTASEMCVRVCVCFDRSDTVHESARSECTVQSQHPRAHERSRRGISLHPPELLSVTKQESSVAPYRPG